MGSSQQDNLRFQKFMLQWADVPQHCSPINVPDWANTWAQPQHNAKNQDPWGSPSLALQA